METLRSHVGSVKYVSSGSRPLCVLCPCPPSLLFAASLFISDLLLRLAHSLHPVSHIWCHLSSPLLKASLHPFCFASNQALTRGFNWCLSLHLHFPVTSPSSSENRLTFVVPQFWSLWWISFSCAAHSPTRLTRTSLKPQFVILLLRFLLEPHLDA